MTLLLDETDVRRALPMAGAIEALESLHGQADDGDVCGERVNLSFTGGILRLMPAALGSRGVAGYKSFHTVHGLTRYKIELFSLVSGQPLATIDANHLTVLRTAATAALAAKYLARPRKQPVGVIGSGAEASAQLRAVAAIGLVRDVRVFSPRRSSREAFRRAAIEELAVEVEAVDTPQEAVGPAELVIAATATEGHGPALLGRWIEPDTHVSSIGSTLPSQREVDPDVWRVADRIVVDTAQALVESGDAMAGHEAGAIDPDKVRELAEVVRSGPVPRSEGEITLYKSVGSALQDVAVALAAYDRAKTLGLGRALADFQTVKNSTAGVR